MRIIAAGMILLASASVLYAESPASPYVLQRKVLLPELTQQELISLRVDETVLSAVPGSLESLQLRNAAGEPIAYLVRKASTSKEQTTTRWWTGDSPKLKPLPGNGLEITIELKKDDPQPDGLRIITPLQNFEQRVTVSTSSDGTEWTAVTSDALIFDYSEYMDVRNDKVPLPSGKERHFRIVVEDVTAEQESQLMELTKTLQGGDETQRTERSFILRRPFRIDRIEFSHSLTITTSDEPLKTSYPITEWNYVAGEDEKHSRVEIKTPPVPLTEFTLQASEKNFSRHVALQTRDKAKPNSAWRTITSKTISRLEFKNVKQAHLSLEFPEIRNTEYRIEIDNQDSPRLDVTGVEAKGDVYELVFLAGEDSKKQSQLVFGLFAFEKSEPLTLDTAAIQALLQKGFVPLAATLGEPIKDSDLPPVPAHKFNWNDLLNNKPVLLSAIGVLVLALGWGLYNAAKRVDALPKE